MMNLKTGLWVNVISVMMNVIPVLKHVVHVLVILRDGHILMNVKIEN